MNLFGWNNKKKAEGAEPRQDGGDTAVCEMESFSEPFVSKNLTVFLLRGKDLEGVPECLTLEEALEQGVVVVEETGVVNTLRVKNTGKTRVFIQSGDILKGGKQDRAIREDLVLEPECDFVSIHVFCVERGRWRKRGLEDDSHFSHSGHLTTGKDLKMAYRYGAEQNAVWQEVSNFQAKAARSAGVSNEDVTSDASPTSLNLTLDNQKVSESTSEYLESLKDITTGKNDVVGFAFAINGKLSEVEVYPSSAFFRKMWPKLIASAAHEAFCESFHKTDDASTSVEGLKELMKEVEQSQGRELRSSAKSRTVVRETDQTVFFESLYGNPEEGELWMHRNYVSRQGESLSRQGT
ncbi:MAG: hypothetical protein KC777_17880 [Cyanobacteria bacterium HKST-UBA02]|nr:hypothetical protein [Cyanobacteria bacterium HKST-UBA02]